MVTFSWRWNPMWSFFWRDAHIIFKTQTVPVTSFQICLQDTPFPGYSVFWLFTTQAKAVFPIEIYVLSTNPFTRPWNIYRLYCIYTSIYVFTYVFMSDKNRARYFCSYHHYYCGFCMLIYYVFNFAHHKWVVTLKIAEKKL